MRKYLKLPGVGFIESASYSLNNFLLTVFFGLNKDYGSAYGYGMSLTISLIALSVLRNSVFINFSLGGLSKSALLRNSICIAVPGMVFGVAFVEIESTSSLSVKFTPLIFISIYIYNVIHEMLRYAANEKIRWWFAGFTSLLLLTNFISLLLFEDFGVESASFLCLAFALFDMVLFVVVKEERETRVLIGSVGWKLKSFYVVLSQISLVHLPFFYLSAIAGHLVVAKMFVLRSVFQGVQVALRANEISQQKAFREKLSVSTLNSALKQNLFIALFFGFLSGVIFLGVAHGLGRDPGLLKIDILLWFLIFISLSLLRPYEVFFHAHGRAGFIYIPYFVGSLLLILFSMLSAPFCQNTTSMSVGFLLAWSCVLALSFRGARRVAYI